MNEEDLKAKAECLKPMDTDKLVENISKGAVTGAVAGAIGSVATGGIMTAPAVAIGAGTAATTEFMLHAYQHVKDTKDCLGKVDKKKEEPKTPPPTPRVEAPKPQASNKPQASQRGAYTANFTYAQGRPRFSAGWRF